MRDRHGTPFEHNAFRFHIRCPIFVAREWFRHRIGSFNEFSMRYAKATDDFYVPEADDVRSQVGKPGAYSFEPVEPELAERTREELQAVYDAAYATYTRLVEQGVARELARSVLPVGAYTEFYWTVNARALMNFVSLRAAETAQREIRRYAEAVRAVPRRAHADHARRVRRERPHRALVGARHRNRRRLPSRPRPRGSARLVRGEPRHRASRSGAGTSSPQSRATRPSGRSSPATPTTGRSEQQAMVNYRVDDLDAMLEQLRAAGAEVDDKVEEMEFGRFGWAVDPEGNRFELWQPAAASS